jgi:rhamnogalacturonyl hydrolase YesR
MKYLIKILSLVALFPTLLFCSDDITEVTEDPVIEDGVPDKIAAVLYLKAEATNRENEIKLSWTNPDDEHLHKIEISYEDVSTRASANPTLIDAVKGEEMTYFISVPRYATYRIGVTTINKAGVKSIKRTVDARPLAPTEDDQTTMTPFLGRADTLMTALVNLYLGGPRDVWNSSYPNATGPYWDGDATVWGQGAGFSAYSAIREATINTPLESKYANMDERMLKSINNFFTYDEGIWAYAVYPQSGNQRFYDDNAWIGLDMIDLYTITGNPEHLDKAVKVWEYLQKGTDEVAGGGIYWREIPPTYSKHTCSTAPGAVLALKLYTATGDAKYLENAIQLYEWLKNTLQDPADYLYWDNAKEENGEIIIEKNKYSYNAGQPMQAAVLLYRITGNKEYLTDARNIARSAYATWFNPFYSVQLNKSIRILTGHVWFNAIMFRGYIELYKTELEFGLGANRTYITAYENSLSHAWLSNCRQSTNLLNEDFTGRNPQSNWDVLHQGASAEMLARLASLERDGI